MSYVDEVIELVIAKNPAQPEFHFISPEELRIPDYLVDETLEPTHTPYEEVSSLEDSLPKLDVLYMTRVQKERFIREINNTGKNYHVPCSLGR